jgi:pyruvate dehydrogenase E1 component alpha subunit
VSGARAGDDPFEGCHRVLDPEGRVLPDATVPDLADARLLEMYEQLRFARRFDERMVSLQRQGRVGTYSPLAGQEAAQVASTHALREDDPILYQYREHGAVVVRGFLAEYIRYWMGHEIGNEALADRSILPLNICIADHIPHATGMAWAAKLSGDDRVVACHFGDGATSEGDFHEGLNFAGVFDVPAVFFCNNNQWAISVPRERQTASATIAQKADAYGFEGVRVDGMDPLAVYQVTREAVEKARTDGEQPRPTLVEAVMYRFGAHTTADDPDAYRAEEEVERWREYDPLPRFETFLRDQGVLDDDRVAAVERRVDDELAEYIDVAERVEADPTDIFDYAYEELTPRLREQREYLQALRERHGDEALLRED